MSHTPGPWLIDSNGVSICSGVRVLARATAGEDAFSLFRPDEVKANARLIAAAPEMLVVLRRVIDQANCAMEYEGVYDAHTLKRALERISKAKRECERVIAKAEGRAEQ